MQFLFFNVVFFLCRQFPFNRITFSHLLWDCLFLRQFYVFWGTYLAHWNTFIFIVMVSFLGAVVSFLRQMWLLSNLPFVGIVPCVGRCRVFQGVWLLLLLPLSLVSCLLSEIDISWGISRLLQHYLPVHEAVTSFRGYVVCFLSHVSVLSYNSPSLMYLSFPDILLVFSLFSLRLPREVCLLACFLIKFLVRWGKFRFFNLSFFRNFLIMVI